MTGQHIAVIAPCFNEGEVAVRFIQELEGILARLDMRSTIIMVDDSSFDDTLLHMRAMKMTAPNVDLHVIALPYNMGHQEAIYQGLLYADTTDAERFIVMDSDGEDDPNAIPELVGNADVSIVFVARGKRSESLLFRIGYWIYRRIFRAITGSSMSFGNYSIIDRKVLRAALDLSFVHYAAFLTRQKVTSRSITYDRRRRIDGRSKMSMKSLSIHAFRSLIEYSESVLSTFLKAFMLLTLVFMVLILLIFVIKLFTPYGIPGWASTLSVSLFNSMLLCLGFFSIGLLLVNSAQRRERAGKHRYQPPLSS